RALAEGNPVVISQMLGSAFPCKFGSCPPTNGTVQNTGLLVSTNVGEGNRSRLSSTYRSMPTPICRRLLRHWTILACSLAPDKAGRSKLARIAMMAITTKSSTSVKPLGRMQRDCRQRHRASTLRVAGAFMSLFFSMIYAKRVLRGSAFRHSGEDKQIRKRTARAAAIEQSFRHPSYCCGE